MHSVCLLYQTCRRYSRGGKHSLSLWRTRGLAVGGKHAWKRMAPSQVESLPLCDLNVQAAVRAKQMAFQGLQRGGSLLTSEYLSSRHSWGYQTQDPNTATSGLINFICIATETNLLPAASPGSQRLGFLIIITLMSYTCSRLVFWLPKKQMAKMSKMFLLQFCQMLLFFSVWRSSQSVENYPFFWVLAGSYWERRLNFQSELDNPLRGLLSILLQLKKITLYVLSLISFLPAVNLGKRTPDVPSYLVMDNIVFNWEGNFCLVTACYLFLCLFFHINKSWHEFSQT